jgi:hypothetical protein
MCQAIHQTALVYLAVAVGCLSGTVEAEIFAVPTGIGDRTREEQWRIEGALILM